MSYYNASLKHNPDAEHLREGGRAGWIKGEKGGKKFVGPQEQNIQDRLMDRQQSVTQEKRRR